jgi:hypothetical protein
MRRPTPTAHRWLAAAAVSLLAMALYGSAAAAPPAQAPTCRWTRFSNGDSRTEVSLATFPGKGLLAYGGADIRPNDASVKDDLHQLDLSASASGSWTELRPSGSGPGDRAEHSAVSRATDGGVEMVVYGGIDGVPQTGGTFTWRSPLLAGGSALDAQPLGFAPLVVERDAHILDIDAGGSAAWVRVAAQGQARTDHSAVLDPDGPAMIVFGGRSDEEATSAENTTGRLTLSGTPTWSTLSGGGTPPSKRFAHTAVYDPVGKRMVVFGGTSDWRTAMNDVHALNLAGGWSGASWGRLTPGGTAPAARYNHGAVYVPELQWMVVYGGTRDGRGQYDDTYALDLAADPPQWIEINAVGSRPGDLQSMGAAYADVGGYAVVYGGQAGSGQQRSSRNQAWGLKCESTAPTATPTQTEPGPTSTPTPTETPALSDVTVSGLVYSEPGGMGSPVAGATVAVGFALPHQPVSAVTGADGRYELLVPGMYLSSVNQISVTAAGYETVTQPVTGEELRANPQRDFPLTPQAPTATPTDTESPTPDVPTATPTSPTPPTYYVYAPIVLKEHRFPGR